MAAAPEPEPVLRKVWLPVNQAWMVTWHGQRIAGPITEAEADRLMAASQGPEGATS